MRSGKSHGTIWGTGPQVLLFPRAEGPLMPGFQSPSQVQGGVIKNIPQDLQKSFDLHEAFKNAVTTEESRAAVKAALRHRVEKTLGIFTLREVPMMVLLNKDLRNFPDNFVYVPGGLGNARMETWFYDN